jgi:hypothetical protein
MNTPSTLFINDTNKNKNQDNEIDNRLHKRQENFENNENFFKIKENSMTKELFIGENFRTKKFLQMRLKQNLFNESTQNLKNNLTIPLEWYEKCNNIKVDFNNCEEIISAFKDSDLNQKYLGLVGIKKLVSLKENSPTQQLINLGIIPELISLLDSSPLEFQYESLRCLTDITSGTCDQTLNIITKDNLDKISKAMESPIEEIKIQSIWLIGNLALDSTKIRDILIDKKIFDKILLVLASTNNIKIIKQCTWTVIGFFRLRPKLSYELSIKTLKLLARILVLLPEDKEFLSEACFFFSYMTETFKSSPKLMLDLNIIPYIVKCLDVDSFQIQMTCLRIIGNIATGDANQTQLLIDLNILNYFKKTIVHEKKIIRKETSWIISNIAAGTQKQIEALISQDFLPILIECIKHDEIEVKKECIWGICNLTSVANVGMKEKILKQGILEIIFECLEMDEPKVLAVCLEALSNLLLYGKETSTNGQNKIALQIEKMGKCDLLEKLQYYRIDIIYDKVIKLLIAYFKVEYNE